MGILKDAHNDFEDQWEGRRCYSRKHVEDAAIEADMDASQTLKLKKAWKVSNNEAKLLKHHVKHYC